MKNKTLAIYDLEYAYADSLMHYISNKQHIPFKTICFTNKNSLYEYLEENHIDILLIATEVMENNLEEQDIEKIILLSNGQIFAEYIGYASIYKYQSSEKIIKELLEYFADVSSTQNKVDLPERQAQIIGVYSPVSGIGQTTFAITLGQVLSTDHTTLYINMEEFSPLGKIFTGDGRGDLSDLMYFYRQNPDNLAIKLQAIIGNLQGLDYVLPLVYSEDLRNIDTREWISLIRKIASCCSYDKVIIDLSSMVKNVFEILDICESIYTVMNEKEVSRLKIASYEEYLLKSDKEEILDKTIKVSLPLVEESKGNIYEQQVWGKMGDCVRQIITDVA